MDIELLLWVISSIDENMTSSGLFLMIYGRIAGDILQVIPAYEGRRLILFR
jgi:hypothetical protein